MEQVLIFWQYSVRGRALGEERGECVIGCALVVLSNCVIKGEGWVGSNLASISLAIVGHSYISWVAVRSGALQRGQSGDLFLRSFLLLALLFQGLFCGLVQCVPLFIFEFYVCRAG